MKNTSNRFLTIAVVLLLLVNIAMIVFMVRGRNHHDLKHPGKPGSPFETMEKELNMDDKQKEEVKKLRDEHFAGIRPLFDSIRAAKTAFFSLVKDPNVTDSQLNVYDKRITDIQSTIDKLTFAHFKSVRALFNADQQQKYDEFIQKMMQRRKDTTVKR